MIIWASGEYSMSISKLATDYEYSQPVSCHKPTVGNVYLINYDDDVVIVIIADGNHAAMIITGEKLGELIDVCKFLDQLIVPNQIKEIEVIIKVRDHMYSDKLLKGV